MAEVNEIKYASRFAIGDTGFPGSVSKAEKSLCATMHRSDGKQLLKGLLKTATPTGKLYVLLGLEIMDRRQFLHEVTTPQT